MSSAIDKLKRKASGKMFKDLMKEVQKLREEQKKTNKILEKVLSEVSK